MAGHGKGSRGRPTVRGPGGTPVPRRSGAFVEVNLAQRHGSEELAALCVAEGEGGAPFVVPKAIMQRDPSTGVDLLVGLGNTSRPPRDLWVLTGSCHRVHV